MNPRTTRALLIPTLILTIGMSGCSSQEDKTEEGAVAAVEDYVDEFNDGDYSDACDRLTDDYVEEMLDEWNEEGGFGSARTCSAALEQGAEFLRIFGELEDDDDILEIDEISAELDGDEAVVDVAYTDEETATYSLVYDDGSWLIDEDLDGGAESEAPTEEGSSDASEPPVAPSAIGDTVELGDWSITVTEVEENANASIAKANEYNEKPEHRYIMFTYEAVYNGDDRTAHADADLTWSFTASDATVIEPDSQVTPGQNQNWPLEVRTGGTARGQVVFDVDPSLTEGGTLGVEAYDEDFNEIFIDFTF